MAADSKIEWTDATWNPVRGCEAVSPGCLNCYAAKDALRWTGEGMPYEGLAKTNASGLPIWTGEVRAVPKKLIEPFGWPNSKNIFVNSMSDLFHADVPFEYVDRVFCVMIATTFRLPLPSESAKAQRWHTYQILTKRADRQLEYMQSRSPENWRAGDHPIFKVRGETLRGRGLDVLNAAGVLQWPPPNVWLGVSVEDQQRADERIPIVQQTPAAVRFLSIEPLLGEVRIPHAKLKALDWVIVGGESGPRARPMHADWVRRIRDDCERAGVAFFFKQWGEFRTVDVEVPTCCHCACTDEQACEGGCSWIDDESVDDMNDRCSQCEGKPSRIEFPDPEDDRFAFVRVGKKAAGRLLDGKEWSEFPRTERNARIRD